NARSAVAFKNWNSQSSATHAIRLSVSDGNERAVGDTLHEPVTEGVGGNAKSPDIILHVDVFNDLRICCTRLNERAAGRFEELVIKCMSSAMLGYLASPSGDDILVAFPATLGVIGRTEPLFCSFNLFKDKAAVVKRAR